VISSHISAKTRLKMKLKEADKNWRFKGLWKSAYDSSLTVLQGEREGSL
jgi:hypothetical protein